MTEAAKSHVEALLAEGEAALRRGDWADARACFEHVLESAELPSALEGLGSAAWWLDDIDITFKVRERAFQLYREQGDPRAAARVATALALDYVEFQGELAVADGWLQVSDRLLAGLGPCPELGWLRGHQAMMLITSGFDVEGGSRMAEEAEALGKSLGLFDLEMLAVALKGFVLVRKGQVREGMRLMDEATAAAIGGEVHNLAAAGGACCTLIYACESIGDYERAAQWSARAKAFCRRWNLESFFSVCRVYYANVLILRGDWAEAESDLEAVAGPLMLTRPAIGYEAIGRLGELRRRQGRIEEAESFFDQTEANPMGLLGRARILLDRGDGVTAADLIARFLRRISEEERAERVFGLAALHAARLLQNDLAAASETLAELNALADVVATPLLLGYAARARAVHAHAADGPEAARLYFEDALDLFQQAGAPFEASQARIDLARTLEQLDRVPAARREVRLAYDAFRTLGARLEAERALNLLRRLDPSEPSPAEADAAGLTRREVEVVRLIAAGKSNQEIAEDLVLSIRTVERHISSIYLKLGIQGPSARAAATAYALSRRLAS
jgi:ATP/maltotriose-dependent transcriptional regulator MalT